MGLREWANQHPRSVAGIVGGLIVIVIALGIYEFFGNRPHITTAAPNGFFSTDDGKTFFTASRSNYPPFTYEGQTAVSANVYECGGTKFVAYLQRFTPEGMKELVAADKEKRRAGLWVHTRGSELKKPGDPTWTNGADMKAVAKISAVKCPSGSSDVPQPAEP